PPFSKADLYQPEKSKNKILEIILISVFWGGASFFFSLFYKKRRMKTADQMNIQSDTITEIDNDTEITFGISTIRSARKQGIYLFGGFQLIDKDGNDLTIEFKPLVKNLFLLVLLNTLKNGKGISFLKLKEILWFDKNEESANNNRGVAMTKIRQILENVGEVKFNKQGGYWSIEFGNEFYCDYYEALILSRKIKKNAEATNIDDVKRLVSIVSGGELLPSVQIEWIDAFKSDFSNDLVDLFMDLIRKKGTEFSDAIYIDIANAIFIHDPLNEDALKLKCAVLVKLGKNGLARNTYLTFTKEYTAWFGVSYKYSFDQVINS
ncbi:hypothetical protein EZS27_038108, partial [termite gut metagenome]